MHPGVLNLPTDRRPCPCLCAVGDCVRVQLHPDSEPEVSCTQPHKQTLMVSAEVLVQCASPVPVLYAVDLWK
jgi:hypothetical protein